MSATVRLTLAHIEGVHLLNLLDEFVELLTHVPAEDDPAVRRLAPDPYPGDEYSSAEFRRATQTDLLSRRLVDAAAVRRHLAEIDESRDRGDAARATPTQTATVDISIPVGEMDAWLRTLSGIRLVIASRLGVDHADEHDAADERFGVYDWLGYRLDQLVQLADAHDVR